MYNVYEEIIRHNEAIRLLLNVAKAPDSAARNKALHAYAEHEQSRFKDHVDRVIEQANDAVLIAEILGAANYPEVKVIVHDKIKMSDAY